MPVFRHVSGRHYLFISYKVLYTRFHAAKHWQQIRTRPTTTLLMETNFRKQKPEVTLLMRSPYRRAISCFMDKFRMNPVVFNSPGFQWQDCQRLLFRFSGIDPGASDDEIAERLLKLSFNDYLDALRRIYRKNGHFHPQHWTLNIYAGPVRLFAWPGIRIANLENQAHLEEIPDVDWSVRLNVSSNVERDFEITADNRKTILDLYGKDFELGGYTY